MKFLEDVDFTVDEYIWGHRLYDEQLPHLIFLEFLGILADHRDQPFRENDGCISYKPQKQMRLRGVLFNNPYIEMIAGSRHKSDDNKWQEWQQKYAEGSASDEDMSYLREVFNSFDEFSRVVELLRSSAFEVNSNKRWSSKFVFPFGPDALFEDLRVNANGNASNDRRFFARTGEILYLMLCRAKRKEELGNLLVNRLLDSKLPLNRLVKAIQGDVQYSTSKEIGYLPLHTHHRFDQLCEDWIHILKQNIPSYDAIQYLIASTGLNMLLYFLERSKEIINDGSRPRLLCEIISNERTKIRAISADDYQYNQNISKRAIEVNIAGIKETVEWLNASKEEYPGHEYIKLMQNKFNWPHEEHTFSNSDDLIQKLTEKALSRHSQHMAKVHSAWSKSIGLSSRRLTRRMRYAPNDAFLKSLVVMVVDKRMQLDEFLEVIYIRYGLVVGEAQGKDLIEMDQIDQEALSRNSGYLSARLASLGLVRQLSDGCAFVENPFSIQEDHYEN